MVHGSGCLRAGDALLGELMIFLDHLLSATSGSLLYVGKHTHFDTFNQDTRQLMPGELFVAVRGERGDGHDYLLEAAQRGAAGLLIEARVFSGMADAQRAKLEQAGYHHSRRRRYAHRAPTIRPRYIATLAPYRNRRNRQRGQNQHEGSHRGGTLRPLCHFQKLAKLQRRAWLAPFARSAGRKARIRRA